MPVFGCYRCGGVIIHSSIGRARVNGRLEMTRSLGDVDLKRFGVIAEPEIRQMKVRLHLIIPFLISLASN